LSQSKRNFLFTSESVTEGHPDKIADQNGRCAHELKNLHALGILIARSALAREESRGSHYRSDFPYRDDEKFQSHSQISLLHDPSFEK